MDKKTAVKLVNEAKKGSGKEDVAKKIFAELIKELESEYEKGTFDYEGRDWESNYNRLQSGRAEGFRWAINKVKDMAKRSN